MSVLSRERSQAGDYWVEVLQQAADPLPEGSERSQCDSAAFEEFLHRGHCPHAHLCAIPLSATV